MKGKELDKHQDSRQEKRRLDKERLKEKKRVLSFSWSPRISVSTLEFQ